MNGPEPKTGLASNVTGSDPTTEGNDVSDEPAVARGVGAGVAVVGGGDADGVVAVCLAALLQANETHTIVSRSGATSERLMVSGFMFYGFSGITTTVVLPLNCPAFQVCGDLIAPPVGRTLTLSGSKVYVLPGTLIVTPSHRTVPLTGTGV